MKLIFDSNIPNWINEGATSEIEKPVAKAVTAAMREAGQRAAAAATAQVRAAGFASPKWDILAKNFPASGDSLDPEVWLHSRNNFEDVFTEGRAITGPRLLWLPLPNVPLWPGDSSRQMSPKKYQQNVGPLVMIKPPGKRPMLAAPVLGPVGALPGGSFIPLRQLRRQIGRGKRTLVPMFVGVPGVVIEKKFDTESAIEKVADDIGNIYVENENR